MNAAFGFQVNRVCGFDSVKVAKVADNPVDVNLRSPFGQRLVPSDAEFAGRSQSFRVTLVLHVDTAGYVSKITDPVVASNAVDVVDFAHGPLAEYVEPREAVLCKSHVIDSHSPVPVKLEMACRLPVGRAKTLRKLANEEPRLGIVLEHIPKASVGEGLFHKTNFTRTGDAYA